MKLSEFFAWWGTFNSVYCDGLTATLMTPNAFSDLIVFKFTMELEVEGTAKTYKIERVTSIEEIESPNGLNSLTKSLQLAVEKIKARTKHDD